MARRPYLPFYASDWRGDTKLGECSLAARGLWIEMIAIMHEADPYGHLVDSTGAPFNFKTLARHVRAEATEVRRLLQELSDHKVFDVVGNVIISRKMVRLEGRRAWDNERKEVRKSAPDSRSGSSPLIPQENSASLSGADCSGARAYQSQDQVSTDSIESAQPAWVTSLRQAVETMLDVELGQLDPPQRFTLGRYHCWRWGNCTVAERRNRARGASVAAGIAQLGADKRYASLRVKDYIAHAETVWKERGGSPWFRPFDITACVEFEAAS